ARRFYERVRHPLLTDISVDWSHLPVADVYPRRIPDLFGAKPVVLTGRYTAGAGGNIRLRGKVRGRELVREIAVAFPDAEPRRDVLAPLWARARIDDLSGQDFGGMQRGVMRDDLRETITQLGLEFRLLTQFTSFVAVEEMIVTDGGQPRRIEVPVELPEGVSREGVFGKEEEQFAESYWRRRPAKMMMGVAAGSGSGFGFSRNRVPAISRMQTRAPISGGVLNSKAVSLPTPQYPSVARAANASGSVSVQVTVDESGNVVSATAVSGHPLLAASAVQAAQQGKFAPTVLSGQPVKITGVITYNFDPSGTTPTALPASAEPDAAPAETEEGRQLRAKLHPSILALVERLRKKVAQPGTGEEKFVRDGKAEVQVWLIDRSPEGLAQLKEIGFEIILEPRSAKLVIGRISVEKLAALGELKAVRYVAPQTAGG
ncbi:MAG: energy transducer TonB, partial [Pyrinomonadaceae bacterium]